MYWFYWESNKETPKNVLLLMSIFKKNLNNYTILTDKTIKDYISIENTENLPHIAQKVDYYRVKILYTYGGIWLDMDTIVLENIDYLYNNLLNSDKEVCISYSKDSVCMQHLISKPKSILFEKCYKLIEFHIIKLNKKVKKINKKIKFLKKKNKNITILNNKKKNLLNVKYDFFADLFAKSIIDNNLQNTILPFPTEIRFSFGCKNANKYYLTDKKFIDENMKKIKDNKYKIIILYGSSGFYNKTINKDTILYKFIEYALII